MIRDRVGLSSVLLPQTKASDDDESRAAKVKGKKLQRDELEQRWSLPSLVVSF
jgi:hypothetical protein